MLDSSIKTVIVGSSPSLLENNLGSLIDTFEHVVRFNCYQIRGYEKHVGTKEKIWAANVGLASHKETIVKKLTQGDVRQIWYVGNSYDIERQFLEIKRNLKKQFVVESINFDVVHLIEEIKSDFKEEGLCFERNKIRLGKNKKYATTGLRAIFKSIERWGKAYVCGFTCWKECVGEIKNAHYYKQDNVPTHMHDAFTRPPDVEHDVSVEAQIIDKLVDMNYIIRLEDIKNEINT